MQWYIRDSKRKEHGPFSTKTLQFWFRYHLLYAAVPVRKGTTGSFEPMGNFETIFNKAEQIQMVDPTEVPGVA